MKKFAIVIILMFGAFPALAEDFERTSVRLIEEFSNSKIGMSHEATLERVHYFDKKIQATAQKLSLREKRTLLSASNVVTVNHPLIQGLSRLLVRDAKSELEKVAIIHNFVLWRITHVANFRGSSVQPESIGSQKGKLSRCLDAHPDGQELERKCGLSREEAWAFSQGNVISALYLGLHNCAGYAILFETLARAAGIPTRIAFTPQSTEKKRPSFHFWNQVYLKGQWIVIDPTFDDSNDSGVSDDVPLEASNFSYSFITPAEAAAIEPVFHKNFEILDL